MKNKKVKRSSNKKIPREPSLVTFPPHVDIKLKYSQAVFFCSTTLSETSYRFRGNGISPVMVTGETGQPWGYDQWSLMYERYLVKKVNARVELVNASTYPLQLVLNYQSDASYNSIDSVTSQPCSTWALVAPTSGTSKTVLTLGVKPESVLALPYLNTALTDYTGVTGDPGSNPVRLFYGTVYVKTLNGSTQGAVGSYGILTLTYDVRLYRRRDVGPS